MQERKLELKLDINLSTTQIKVDLSHCLPINKNTLEIFLSLIEKLCTQNNQDLAKDLQKIFKIAEQVFGKKLGEAYEDLLKNNVIFEHNIFKSICVNNQFDLFYMFAEEGFNCNESFTFALTFLEHAIFKYNYHFIAILAEIGADFNQIELLTGFNKALWMALSNVKMTHYLASLGARDELAMDKSINPEVPRSYYLGIQYAQDYKKMLATSLDEMRFPLELQHLILNYLGPKLSIPPVESPLENKLDFSKRNEVESEQKQVSPKKMDKTMLAKSDVTLFKTKPNYQKAKSNNVTFHYVTSARLNRS